MATDRGLGGGTDTGTSECYFGGTTICSRDWSAVIVQNATLADLDELAVAKARVMYKGTLKDSCQRN